MTRPITATESQPPTELGDIKEEEEEEEEEEEKGMSSSTNHIIEKKEKTSELFKRRAARSGLFLKLEDHRTTHQPTHISSRLCKLHTVFLTSRDQLGRRNRLVEELRVSYNFICWFHRVRMIFSNGSFLVLSFYVLFTSFLSTPNTENTPDSSLTFANWLRK